MFHFIIEQMPYVLHVISVKSVANIHQLDLKHVLVYYWRTVNNVIVGGFVFIKAVSRLRAMAK